MEKASPSLTVVRCENEQPGKFSANNAVDGDWRSEWFSAKDGTYPHELVFAMDRTRPVLGFVYIPPPFRKKGRVLKYEVYVSEKDGDWGEPVAAGEFSKVGGGFWPDTKEKMAKVFFDSPHTGRFIRFRALSAVDGGTTAAIAEFAVVTDRDKHPFKDVMLAELKGQRYAPSVHLGYKAPEGQAFYLEITVGKSVPGSYFEACGFNGGYFGMQEHSGGRKNVIFSVWDTHRGNNPNTVPEENRVKAIRPGEGVRVKRFGGEGTGGQSFLDYSWKIGQTCRFFVRAKTRGQRTDYTAWFFLPEHSAWKRLVTFSAPRPHGSLRGYYSFIEDFRRNFKSFRQVRTARFGNGWVQDLNGQWHALSQARFTRDGNPNTNIDAGPAGNGFFLTTGGEKTKNATTPLWQWMTCPQSAKTPPADLPD